MSAQFQPLGHPAGVAVGDTETLVAVGGTGVSVLVVVLVGGIRVFVGVLLSVAAGGVLLVGVLEAVPTLVGGTTVIVLVGDPPTVVQLTPAVVVDENVPTDVTEAVMASAPGAAPLKVKVA